MTGHFPGDSCCPSKNTGPPVTAFHFHKNIFSNFYTCKLEVDGMSFSSVKHWYQWYQAKDARLKDLAEQFINAPHAVVAKKMSIPQEFRETLEKINVEKMKKLLMAKVSQVPIFEIEAALIESNGNILAEATADHFWASGQLKEARNLHHQIEQIWKRVPSLRTNMVKNAVNHGHQKGKNVKTDEGVCKEIMWIYEI